MWEVCTSQNADFPGPLNSPMHLSMHPWFDQIKLANQPDFKILTVPKTLLQ